MNSNKFQSKITKIGLVLSLVFGFMLLSSTSAQAQYRDNGGYGRNGGYYGNNVYQIAQQNGYDDGLRKGREDAREGHNNPTGTSEYKHATRGYDSSLGNKGEYKRAYRDAFLQGFSDGQNQGYNNGRYGNRNRPYRNNGNILRRIIIGH